MPILADVIFTTDLIPALAAGALACGALAQWVRLGQCAYNVDTGYFAWIFFGLLMVTVGFVAPMFRTAPLISYTALCILLIGLLVILFALSQLFTWSAHRHRQEQKA